MVNKAFIAGVGMIPFVKPGANAPYPAMAGEATRLALADAGVAYDLVQQAYVGYVYGDSTACRARNSAVEPVAQLLLTLKIGRPCMPSRYKAFCPLVESP